MIKFNKKLKKSKDKKVKKSKSNGQLKMFMGKSLNLLFLNQKSMHVFWHNFFSLVLFVKDTFGWFHTLLVSVGAGSFLEDSVCYYNNSF
jgi:hypothetical protein